MSKIVLELDVMMAKRHMSSLLLGLDFVDQSHLAILDDSLEGRVIGIDQLGPLPR